MNKSSRIALPFALSVLALATLTACKTTETAYRAAPAQAPVADTGDLPRFVEDHAYIDRVQRLAESRGISVHWVNKPHKRIPSESAQAERDN